MELCTSLIHILEHQLQMTSKHFDLNVLSATIKLIQDLDHVDEEFQEMLQTLLLSHAKKCLYSDDMGDGQFDSNTSLSQLASFARLSESPSFMGMIACVQLYSTKTVWSVIDLTLRSDVQLSLRLELLIAVTTPHRNITVDDEHSDYVWQSLSHLVKGIIASNNIDLARKAGVLLGQGVKSIEPLVRKQSIYVIKTLLRTAETRLDFGSDLCGLRLDPTKKDMSIASWTNYILLLESLNEKQFHIVQPNLAKIEDIFNSHQQGIIGIDWVLAMLIRTLNHDSMQVKRFGLLFIFRLDYKLYPELTSSSSLSVLSKEFILLSNQSSFFMKSSEDEDWLAVFRAMQNYLHNVTDATKEQHLRGTFLHGVLETLTLAPWCPVSCMYWTAALASLNHSSLKGCWTERSLKHVLKIMSEGFILGDKRLRQATCCYLLTAVIHLTEMTDTAAPSLYSMVRLLRNDRVLVPGSKLWTALHSVLCAAIDAGHVDRSFALKSGCKEELAVMFLTAFGEDLGELHQWLAEVSDDKLNSCHMRPYVNRERVFGALRSLLSVFELLIEEKAKGCVGEMVKKYGESISDYILQLIAQNTDLHADELNVLETYLRVSNHLRCDKLILKLSRRFTEHVTVETTLEWKLLNIILSMKDINWSERSLDDLLAAVFNAKSSRYHGLAEAHTRWLARCKYLQRTAPADVDWQHWCEEAQEGISLFYREDSCIVFNCLELILPHVSAGLADLVIAQMLLKVEEESKNSHYIPLMSSLVKAVFSESLLASSDHCEVLAKAFDQVYALAEERPGVANIISRQLFVLTHHSSSSAVKYPAIHEPLVLLAIFGPIHNKAHRVVEDAFSFLEEYNTLRDAGLLGEEKRVGYGISAIEVRVLAIDTLILLIYENDADTTCCRSTISAISKLYKELLAVKCYSNFPNALSHRQRHRLLCLLLTLMPFCSKNTQLCKHLQKFLMFALKNELQPSCRHQLEWIFIYLLRADPESMYSQLLQCMQPEEMVTEKSSYVCSMFCIAAHTCGHSQTSSTLPTQLETMKTLVPLITPWGMSSKFHMRIHAQAALLKIWQHAHDAGLKEDISACFPLLKANMDFALQSGTATEKNSRKLLENFFYFKFDPVQDYSLEMIFSLWPRLLTMAEEESIPCSVFDELTRELIGDSCQNDSLRSCKPGTWHIKVKEGDNETEMVCSNLQRKITTWRSLSPPEGSFRQKEDGLIVVTSLIDKLPNLGGLCRTAEIFGACEMVVSSLKLLEAPDFLSTSVTAHQWLPMRQVGRHCLPEYLTTMKQQGYTLVGVEQATQSRCLTDYKMPVKTLILLGNEKQGLPVELMQLMDVCVEIPQQGVIRSLNVHVGGALFIWEYRKQRLLDQPTQ
ncbi:probable methyltransferase TARBP1 [Watersipora subatra]|uniref:probable methyltransferase TARBP1 n=1 Tax=Watersipora subatra TaxID=2589382 RepID=UPI00355AD2E1